MTNTDEPHRRGDRHIVLACLTTTACSGSATRSAPHGGSTRATADAHRVTLRLGTDDGRDPNDEHGPSASTRLLRPHNPQE
jgi:hypothetical protein